MLRCDRAAHLGDVVDTLLEGEHDNLLQDGHGLLAGRTDTWEVTFRRG